MERVDFFQSLDIQINPASFALHVLDIIKKSKGMDHAAFCNYLDNASISEVKLIIERLQTDAGIACSVEYLLLQSLDQTFPCVAVHYFCPEFAKSFMAIGTIEEECERLAYASLLIHLSEQHLSEQHLSDQRQATVAEPHTLDPTED